jgi:phosphatidylinositol glycan class O
MCHISGNHGGDSPAELTAAMFVYSPHQILGSVLKDDRDSINQVDLVPTLAAILGTPVPFSSLGSVVVEALPLEKHNWKDSFISVINNINQVHMYIETYSRTANQFTEDSLAILNREYKNLQRMTQNIKTIDDFKSYLLETRKYLINVKNMCEDIWVKFDLILMIIGLFLMITTIIICLIIIQTIPAQKIFDLLDSKKLFYTIGFIFIISIITWIMFGLFLEISCILSLLIGTIVIYNNFNEVRNGIRAQRKHNDRLNFIASILIISNILGMFSNSYVVEESTVVSFCLISLIIATLFSWKKETTIKTSKSHNVNKLWSIVNVEKCVAIILAVVFCIAIRLFQNYWQCREEQSWCQDIPSISKKSSSLFKEVTFLPLISITIPIFIIIFWLKNNGNLVELSITITSIKMVPIIFTILTCVYWVLEALPVKILSKMITWDIQIIPQLIYLLLVILLLCLIIQPLCVHVIPPRKKNFQIDGEKNIVPHIFQHIKNALKEDKEKEKDSIPAVYGLPTVFSASFIVFGLLLMEVLYLWQGSKMAPALVIMFFSSFLLLGVLGVYRIHKAVLTRKLTFHI